MTAASLLPVRAEHALRQSPIPALRRLRLEENEKAVVITGAVSSYYHKQLAQEAVMPFLGQRVLQNRVSVLPS